MSAGTVGDCRHRRLAGIRYNLFWSRCVDARLSHNKYRSLTVELLTYLRLGYAALGFSPCLACTHVVSWDEPDAIRVAMIAVCLAYRLKISFSSSKK